ncbi:unnamed protein product [Allacma fusca]|uniref:Uncharacterized protein n=1 Tax=Allacma fusca TaxID=39272 RepID=A0A8J2L020_9HEXA|nr:unnamed protein product [Allacma fusca]
MGTPAGNLDQDSDQDILNFNAHSDIDEDGQALGVAESLNAKCLQKRKSHPLKFGATYRCTRTHSTTAALMMDINLISPCELLPLSGLLAAVQRLKGQCERQYHKLLFDELRSFCISEDTPSIKVKREPVTFIFVLGIAAMTSAGVGIEIYAAHEIDKVEVLQAGIKRTLDNYSRDQHREH